MRIRKYAKLTPSIIWSTAASPSTPNPPEELMQAHVCLVNRSPWDVPSPPTGNFYQQQPFSAYQEEVEGDDDSLVNIMNSESLNDDSTPLSVAPDYSRQSIVSMKTSSDYDNKTTVNAESASGTFFSPNTAPTPVKAGQYSNVSLESPRFPSLSPAATPTKSNNDNNKYNDDEAAATEPLRRRGRPRKASLHHSSQAPAQNPPDYYYYAGFGPRWSKRRGPDQKVVSSSWKTAARSNTNSKDKHTSRTNGVAVVTSSSSSSMIEYYNNEDNEPVADYIEDDDDDDDEVGVERKKVRKPIKARSLKSIIS